MIVKTKETKIDWNKIKELRAQGLTWEKIANMLPISLKALRREAREYGLDMGINYSKNRGKRMCGLCRHFFPRKELKVFNRIFHCPKCKEKVEDLRCGKILLLQPLVLDLALC